LLRDQELKSQAFLAKQYRDVVENYKLIELRRNRRKNLEKEFAGLLKLVQVGRIDVVSREKGDSVLDASRFLAEAISAEYQSIVDYNNALARFEFAKGTLMQHCNVIIAEGPLPTCAQVRAVDHERERARAFELRDRPEPGLTWGGNGGFCMPPR